MHDEPTSEDRLDRERFAHAIADVIRSCDTPLVIGLYGTWGMGKTSLMRIIESQLEAEGAAITVWFDPWQHQFDEDPAVALLHTMVDELALGEEGRKLLTVIAGALGSVLLRATTNVSAGDLQQLVRQYEEERFQVREKQIRLRAYFEELLRRATDNGTIRLAFFIDDLDRCMPDQVLKVLEALKLYLNLPGCVYILGVDRSALESSIRTRYSTPELSEAEYLDKIVQLPFTIPPIPRASMEDFVRELLPEDLHDVAETLALALALGENPRRAAARIRRRDRRADLARSLIAPRRHQGPTEEHLPARASARWIRMGHPADPPRESARAPCTARP